MAQVLGRYHIINELGRGGMGVVYKALDPKLERFIAIKCLSDELSEDEIVVARFLREARNVASLNHPNIAQIFVADEHAGKPYFVMEYVDGESLAEFIDREGQCSPEMARRVTEQAANALGAAAEEGIVHRDVKPGNIMIDRRGRAVLTDFGIACVTAGQAESGSQLIMGTPGYLPPEALKGDSVDSRSDMFALGAVWYEMLTGQRLMPWRDLKEAFKQLADSSFPDLSAIEGKVDERVLEILRKMLAVQPEERFADWSELLAAMEPLKTGRTGPVERSNSGPSTAEREMTAALKEKRTPPPTTTAASPPAATVVQQDTEVAVETEAEDQYPVPGPQEAKTRRRPLAAVAVLLVLVLALAGTGFGLAYMAPGTWNKMTAWLPGDEQRPAEEVVAASESVPAGDESTPAEDAGSAMADSESSAAQASGGGASARAGQALAENTNGEQPSSDAVGESSGSSGDVAQSSESLAAGESGTPAGGSGSGESVATPDTEPAVADDRSVAMAEPAAADSSPSASIAADTAPEPASEPPPRGIVVIGVGDPVIADPMVREIESALRSVQHPLVERQFVSGYRDYIQGEELDLAALARPALDAGARYVVVARALPAGERQLEYYNRVETAFIAQLEAVTYDLHTMQQMGSSPIEQIEFTSLNATRRAVDSVRPWLEGIRDQFE